MALTHSGYLACVKVISETLASLPLKVYRRTSDDGRELARDRDVYRILHDRPNDLMSSFTLRQVLQQHLLAWGNAYAELEYDKRGRLVAVWPILPDRTKVWIEMRPSQRPAKWLETRVGSEQVVFAPGSFLHIPGMGFDGVCGYSALHTYRNAVGLALATEKFGARWFAGGGKPPVILKTERVLNPEAVDRLRQQWERQHGNLDSANRAVILDEGMDLQAIGVPPDDSQFLQTRKFQISEMARIFRIPPHKIGDLERATFSNIEAQSIEFVQDTILPWCSLWESYLNHDLFSPADRGTLYAEFVLDGLLRGDSKTRAEANAILRSWGILSANEWRKGENLDPIEGGDTYLVPLNMRVVGEELDEPIDVEVMPVDEGDDEPDPEMDDDSDPAEDDVADEDEGRDMAAVLGPLLARAAERVVVQEVRQLERIIARHDGDPVAMADDVEGVLQKLEVWLERELEAFATALHTAGLIDNPAEWIVLSIERYVDDSRGRLARAIMDGRGLPDELASWTARPGEVAEYEMRRLTDVA